MGRVKRPPPLNVKQPEKPENKSSPPSSGPRPRQSAPGVYAKLPSNQSQFISADKSDDQNPSFLESKIDDASHGSRELQLSAPDKQTCPTCAIDYSVWSHEEFADHVKTCSHMDAFADGSSDTSELSEVPDYVQEIDPEGIPDAEREVAERLARQNGNDEESDSELSDDSDDYLEPYDFNGVAFYPDPKSRDAESEDDEDADADISQYQFYPITDPNKYVALLENPKEQSRDQLVKNLNVSVQALRAWQDEWMELERFTHKNQPLPAMTEAAEIKWREKNPWPKNPRIGKDFPRDDAGREAWARKNQGRQHALLHNYEYNPLKAPEDQNPLLQSLAPSGPDGRGPNLRQRVPTQKAAEGEFEDDSEDDNGRRRGRGYGLDGPRIRYPSSRIDSSRDQTPAKTFPSGKKIGRPRKNPIQLQQSLAKQEKARLEGLYSLKPANSKFAHDEDMDIEFYDDDDDDVLQTTEPVYAEESRPTTASSMESSSTQDQYHSSKGKKRQNTSDFEDANRNKKRAKADPDSTESIERAESGGPKNSRSVTMARVQKDAWSKDDGSRRDKLSNSMKERWQRTKLGGGKTLAKAPGAINDAPPKVKKGPKVLEPGEKSAASLNMINRWKKKKEAQRLGLEVPNIGRYAKAKSASSHTRHSSTVPTPQPNVAGGAMPPMMNSGPILPGGHSATPGANSNRTAVELINLNQMKKTNEKFNNNDTVKNWRNEVEHSGENIDSSGLAKRRNSQQKLVKREGESEDSSMGQYLPMEPEVGTSKYSAHKKSRTEHVTPGGVDFGESSATRSARRKLDEKADTNNTGPLAQTGSSPTQPAVRTSGRQRKPTERQVSAITSSRPSTSGSVQGQVSPTTITAQPNLLKNSSQRKHPITVLKVGPRLLDLVSGYRFDYDFIPGFGYDIELGEEEVEQPLDPGELDLAAQKAKDKAFKMSQIMKNRWQNGEMNLVMEKKKANNRARKAAMIGIETTDVEDLEPPAKKQKKPTGAAAHKKNQKPKLAVEIAPAPPAVTLPAPDISPRKQTAYETFQALSSPSQSPLPAKRNRRPAAVAAQRSFIDLDEDSEDDDEETKQAKQVARQLEHNMQENLPKEEVGLPGKETYNAVLNEISPYGPQQLEPVKQESSEVLGKRKRKSTKAFEEVLRLEKEGEDAGVVEDET